MKWAQIRPEYGTTTAVCLLDERVFAFNRTLDDMVAEGELNVIHSLGDVENAGGKELHADWNELPFTRLLTRPGKILCVGLNFTDHAEEVGAPLPEYPTIFTKYSNALIGPGEDIQLPAESNKIDWEVELCAVIGASTRRVSPEDARASILGYTILNDISVRDWQGRTSEWFQGKNWDRSTPFGPAIVTADSLDPAEGLSMQCSVDGVLRQNGTTANMIFSAEEVISYISTFMTLEPGDLVALGTPTGVGLSLRPRQWLSDGQTVTCTIEGIGTLANTCRAES